MGTFLKLPNGNVVYETLTVKHIFQPTLQVLAHPNEANLIMITDDSNNQETDKAFLIAWQNVSSPISTDRNDLITILGTDFFTGVSVSVVADATGLATTEKQDSQLSILNNLLTAVTNNKSFEETIWKDDNDVFFVRRITMFAGVPTLSFQLADGTAYTPVGSQRIAVSNKDIETFNVMYKATANGTGYNINDFIYLITLFDTATTPPYIINKFWFNINSGLVIAEPNSVNIVNVEFTEASEATQLLIKAKTDNLDIALSALRTAIIGTGNKSLTDLDTTQLLIKAKTDNLDIALSALRTSIIGAGSKSLSDLNTLLAAIKDTDGIKKITDIVTVKEKSDYSKFYTNAVNQTSVIKATPGTLRRIIVGSDSGDMLIYDNTSATGTPIASLKCTKVFGSVNFNINFSIGLTIVTTGGVNATLIYE